MSSKLPTVDVLLRNHHLDATRWTGYAMIDKDNDVVVCSSMKSGSTWTRKIVLHLLYGKEDPIPKPEDKGGWVEARIFSSVEDLNKKLASIKGRRLLFSHLPLNSLTYFKEVKYVVVARDPRDVFMSLYNHYSNYSDMMLSMLNSDVHGQELIGGPIPRCPEDIHEFWNGWITKGWDEDEEEGYPFWTNMGHTKSFWEFRHLPNMLFLHYNDMLTDTRSVIKKIADFIEVETSAEDIERVYEATKFATAKKEAIASDEEAGERKGDFFKGGNSAFIFKGTNGRWKDVLTQEELDMYEKKKKAVLPPDCAAWLENGGEVTKPKHPSDMSKSELLEFLKVPSK